MEQKQHSQRDITVHFLCAHHYLKVCEKAMQKTPGMRADSLLNVFRQEIVKDELYALARQFKVPVHDDTKTSTRDKVFIFALMVVSVVAIGLAVMK